MASPDANIVAHAKSLNIELVELPPMSAQEDAAFTSRMARARGARAILVDGYHFKPSYYEALRSTHWNLAALVDMAHQRFPVDTLINLNVGGRPQDYSADDDTTMLFGPRYAMLREQFRRLRALRSGPVIPENISRVLTFMGGGDPRNDTLRALRALAAARYQGCVEVVIGPSNPHRAALEAYIQHSPMTCHLHQNITNMGEVMFESELAICASGGASWELACLGVPMIQLMLADNQLPIGPAIEAAGASVCLGWHEDVSQEDMVQAFLRLNNSPQTRSQMSLAGMRMIDGEGVSRVLAALMR